MDEVVKIKSSATPHTFAGNNLSFNNIYKSPPFVEDINGDGLDDLILVGTNYNTVRNSYTPDTNGYFMYELKYFENTNGGFTDKSEEVFPGNKWYSMILPERISFEDIDGDGLKDLLIPDGFEIQHTDNVNFGRISESDQDYVTNFDAESLLSVWFGAVTGSFQRTFFEEQRFLSFNHDIEVLDSNGDGLKEIYTVPLNSVIFKTSDNDLLQSRLKPSTDITNNLGGGYTENLLVESRIDSIELWPIVALEPSEETPRDYQLNRNLLPDNSMRGDPTSLWQFQAPLYTIDSDDYDGDGFEDLLTLVAPKPFVRLDPTPFDEIFNGHRIYWGSAEGFNAQNSTIIRFSDEILNYANEGWGGNGYETISQDFNGDGRKDLFIKYEAFSNNDLGALEYNLHELFLQTETRSFSNATNASLGGVEATYSSSLGYEQSYDVTRSLDVDGDQDLDLVAGGYSFWPHLQGSVAYLENDGFGRFEKVELPEYWDAISEIENLSDPKNVVVQEIFINIDGFNSWYGVAIGNFSKDQGYEYLVFRNQHTFDESVSEDGFISVFLGNDSSELKDHEIRPTRTDISGSLGQTAKVLAAVIGEDGLSNKELVGIGLQLFDAGQSLAEVCELALGAVGATTHEAVVNLLYTNLYGEAPTTEQAQPFVDLLDDGIFTKGSLASAAAELTDDLGVIDLVGLAETGIEYV